MGQRFYITENERSHINKLYGFINESFITRVVNANSKLIINDLQKVLDTVVLPDMVRQINEISKIDDRVKLYSSEYKFGASSKITKYGLTINNFEAQDVDKKRTFKITVDCTVSLSGVASGYFGESSIMPTKLSFDGTTVSASFIADLKCGVNDEEDVKGEDNRFIQLDRVIVNLNSAPAELYLKDENGKKSEDKVGSFRIQNNDIVFTVDDFNLTRRKSIPVNDMLHTNLVSNKNLVTYKFKDYPEQLENIPLLDFCNIV